jgi:phage terminase large subunit-like protein
MRPTVSSPADRWRPLDRSGPPCGFTFDGRQCWHTGAHHCHPRADRAVGFFPSLLVHTKGRFARHAFTLDAWQEHDIIRPLFGEVQWSEEWEQYVRRYTEARIFVARKNGKSETGAGLVLLLLVGDDEEAAEVYGAAMDTKQADKVGEVVRQMRKLSPILSGRLAENKNSKRIFDAQTSSYYEIITGNAKGELGANPHGFILDELVSQPNGKLWEAMVTAEGTRTQPLFVQMSTEVDDPSSWAATQIDEAERIEEDPSRAPHVFVYVRRAPSTPDQLERLQRLYPGDPRLPVSCDWDDEQNWYWPNPALGSFKSLEAMRKQALKARNEPATLNGFLQFQLNRRVQQLTRYLPIELWDACAGLAIDDEKLVGQSCFGGLDLSATTDLSALALLFPGPPHRVIFRFWVPELAVPQLDLLAGGPSGQLAVWVREGLIRTTEGDLIDYDVIEAEIHALARRFRIVDIGTDRWNSTGIATRLLNAGVRVELVNQGMVGISPGTKELLKFVKGGPSVFLHGGHPVARWNADSLEVKQDENENVKPVKPNRGASGKRIDGMVALIEAIDGWMRRGRRARSVYETRGLETA